MLPGNVSKNSVKKNTGQENNKITWEEINYIQM
jgi:hypothetical protein